MSGGHGSGAHHRTHRAGYGGTPGRSAEIVALIQAAGEDGIHYAELAAALCRKPCNIEAMLATVTSRYPAVYEDDDRRIFWYNGDDAGEDRT